MTPPPYQYSYLPRKIIGVRPQPRPLVPEFRVRSVVGWAWRHHLYLMFDDSISSLPFIRECMSRDVGFVCVGKGARPRNSISLRHYARARSDVWVYIANSADMIRLV